METYVISFQTKKMDEPQYVVSISTTADNEITHVECGEDIDKAFCFTTEIEALQVSMYMGSSAKVQKIELEYKHQ